MNINNKKHISVFFIYLTIFINAARLGFEPR